MEVLDFSFWVISNNADRPLGNSIPDNFKVPRNKQLEAYVKVSSPLSLEKLQEEIGKLKISAEVVIESGMDKAYRIHIYSTNVDEVKLAVARLNEYFALTKK